MDKTLGLTNVVTEQNFPLLWQEMIQPHLEVEREKGKAAVEAEKAEARKKLGRAQGKLQSLEQEKQLLAKSLEAQRTAKLSEDQDAIEGLCLDVAKKLRRGQVHVMRSACEQEAAAVAARQRDPALSRELSQIIELQRDAAQTGDLPGFTRLDHAFHDTIFRHARLEHVRRVLRRESGHIDRLRALHLMQSEKTIQICSDHTAICDAIAVGDEAAARSAMRHHLSQSILISEKLRETRPEFFSHSIQQGNLDPEPVE